MESMAEIIGMFFKDNKVKRKLEKEECLNEWLSGMSGMSGMSEMGELGELVK